MQAYLSTYFSQNFEESSLLSQLRGYINLFLETARNNYIESHQPYEFDHHLIFDDLSELEVVFIVVVLLEQFLGFAYGINSRHFCIVNLA